MGITKTEIFTNEQNQLATMLKVLGHPARLAILNYIIQQNACICTDIVEEIGLAQSTISQHLKRIKKYWNHSRDNRRKVHMLLYQRAGVANHSK